MIVYESPYIVSMFSAKCCLYANESVWDYAQSINSPLLKSVLMQNDRDYNEGIWIQTVLTLVSSE